MPPLRPESRYRCAKLVLLLLIGALSACGKKSVVIDGQKFVVRTIDDQQQKMPYCALQIPVGWQFGGEVRWRYDDVSNPVTVAARATDPNHPRSVELFPRTACYWLQGASAYNRRESRDLGQLNVAPMPPAAALREAILKIYRAQVPGIQVVGTRELPGLAAMLKCDPAKNHGIGVKVTYTENGTPMEEEFYALYYYIPIGYDGPQGHSVQLDWGVDLVHSFKAPVGEIDQHRDLFSYVIHSIHVNPTWMQRAVGINKYLNDQFNRNLAQGYAQIEAAGQLSRQISANNDAMIASMDQQRAATNATSATNRSSADKFDDNIRGVDTVNDPYTGTSQQTGTYHWTDGYGSYANTNDPNFDPNRTANVTWTQMTSVQ